MRKFFRSIHWGDKVIDILVVVLGITIAFGLNNWRENRQNAKLEQQYLKNMKEDLVKDTVRLVEIKEEMTGVFTRINRMLELSPNKDNADSIPKYLGALNYDFFIFFPEDYTYQTLQQSGDIAIIQNDSIRQVISHLYDNYELIELLREVAYDYQFNLILPLVANYDSRRNKIIDPFIYTTPAFDNAVGYYRSALRNYRGLINDSLEKHRILQRLINEELDE